MRMKDKDPEQEDLPHPAELHSGHYNGIAALRIALVSSAISPILVLALFKEGYSGLFSGYILPVFAAVAMGFTWHWAMESLKSFTEELTNKDKTKEKDKELEDD